MVPSRPTPEANALSAYWNAITRGASAAECERLAALVDPADRATIREVHAAHHPLAPDPRFAARLEQLLLQEVGRSARLTPPTTLLPLRPDPTAMPTHPVPPAPAIGPIARSFDVAARIALATLIALLTVSSIWLFSGRPDRPGVLHPPVTEIARTDTIDGVPMWRGNPARTGQMPGPGITGAPVIARTISLDATAYGSMVLADDTLITSSNALGLVALDPATGTVRWSKIGSEWYAHTLPVILDENTVYSTTFYGAFVALDLRTGTERWRVENQGFSQTVLPLLADGVIYLAGGLGNLYALDATTGDLRWHVEIPGVVIQTTASADGRLVVGTTNGQVHALDAATGAAIWQTDLDQGSATLDVLAIANGRVYVTASKPVRASDAGFATALDATTGTAVWRTTANPGGGYTLMAVDADRVYLIGPDRAGGVLAVDAGTGEHRWTASVGGPVGANSSEQNGGDPALVDGVLYIGSHDGVLHGLDAATGTSLWTVPLDSEVSTPPLVTDGIVYIGTSAGTISVITGSSPPTTPTPTST